MNKITTYQDLIEAKKQLEAELATRRAHIQVDLEQLREGWKPLAALLSGLGKFPLKSNINPAISIGINLLGHALIQSILPARTGRIATAIMPLLAKGFFNLIGRFKSNGKAVSH